MLQVALANIKTYARRYIAVLLAVAIGTAFLGATLAVNSSTTATLKNSLGDQYKNADLVLSQDRKTAPDTASALTLKDVEGLRALNSVASANGTANSMASMRTSQDRFDVFTQPVAAKPATSQTLLEGRAPKGEREVILDVEHAKSMEVNIGDTVAMEFPGEETVTADAKVVGLQASSTNPMRSGYAQVGLAESWWQTVTPEPSAEFGQIVIDAKGDDPSAAREEVSKYFADQNISYIKVLSADEQVVQDVAQLTGGNDQLTIILLVFAMVALVVTGLVVMNTFSVVIAQRTRELALLRTLGAKRGQIRSSVLMEALLIGILASAVGVLLAIGLLAGLIAVLKSLVPTMSYATLDYSMTAIWVPLLVGVLMTVLAAWVPARRAMKLAPLAALRPFDAASVRNRAGVLRIVFGSLLTLAGAIGLAAGMVLQNLLIAFAGGLLSFPGILMLASLFVPGAVFGVGKLVTSGSVAGRLAALNSVRNPGRTTATATALLIGVTLVSMIMVGGQSAKSTLNEGVMAEYPVDLSVYSEKPFSDDTRQQLEALESVQATATLQMKQAEISYSDGTTMETELQVVDPEAMRKVALNQDIVPAEGQLVYTPWSDEELTATISGTKVEAKASGALIYAPYISKQTATQLGLKDSPSAMGALMLKLDADLSPSEVQQAAQDIADIAGVESYQVSGGAIEKSMFGQVIDVLLMIVSGLLAVAVLIALIGVANTLSLSVLERTRENALLRALGLKKGQLRSMLATEAVLIGGVAALLGIVLGVAYGLMGAYSALAAVGTVHFSIPWLQLLVVLAVSVVAALLASVTPGRKAARLSPVEGLATE